MTRAALLTRLVAAAAAVLLPAAAPAQSAQSATPAPSGQSAALSQSAQSATPPQGGQSAVPQSAQPAPPTTRAEALRQARESKARRTGASYRPGNLEKWITKIENDRLLEDWLSVGEGGRYYVKFGGITTGAGFAVGPGIRLLRLAGGDIDVNTFAVISYRKYLLAEGSVVAPRLAGARLRLGAVARRRYFPQEDFFGVGPGSNRPDRVNYTYAENAFGGFVGADVAGPLRAEARVEYLMPSLARGRDTLMPSIEVLFTDETAPGLAAQPDFLLTRGLFDLDYATPEGNPRRGGRYIATVSRFSDRDTGHYTFNRLELDLRQYLPFLKDRRVLVFRALASFSDAPGDGQVPFYFQQTLGGSTTLRGFRDYRFRDRNLLLLQAEYRWEILPALDAALFYDAGKVGSRVKDLDLDDLQSDYGFGFRFGTNRGVFLRVDAAFGSRDGKHYFIKFGHVF
ncbi:MAG TPA: BamA/TamA family outer membrane protein [Vicinamibacterales bacterium]|nr:BamA/TamA family outer membrane protein [Vicinamibacterales bacterium]